MNSNSDNEPLKPDSPLDRLILMALDNKLIVIILTLMAIGWGMMVAPFDWDLGSFPRDPISVDAIPDIGENQQIVFTPWPGHSPQDIEDQITYPLTVALLGLPGVKSVRSFSMFGFSTVYVIFTEDVEFYWSRSRILEKLSSLPNNSLPAGVSPALGPDATPLGQVFWYTLEGRDSQGNPTGGWDLSELRSIQDWQVRYSLQAAQGISEVASIGGYVKEYQIDVNPRALNGYGLSLQNVFAAIRTANLDIGARTIEVNRVEYLIRGLGFFKSLEDIENTIIKTVDGAPVYVRNVATVSLGPAPRRGALDKGGIEAVGGVAVVRYGFNPLQAIKNVKAKIAEISPGLPSKTLADGTESKVTIVPFYDRTELINETIETLEHALSHELLITIIVVMLALFSLRNALMISGVLPLSVLITFIAMKLLGVEANVVALAGIAIAIGAMVDMAIIMTENISRNVALAKGATNVRRIVFEASREVGGAVLTAVATTVVSFLPVFAMSGAEGKLFKPLAFTKTFALAASVIVALFVIPVIAEMVFSRRKKLQRSWMTAAVKMRLTITIVALAGILSALYLTWWVGILVVIAGAWRVYKSRAPQWLTQRSEFIFAGLAAAACLIWLVSLWLPLGPAKGFFVNLIFSILIVGAPLGAFYLLWKNYIPALNWCLKYKGRFLVLPAISLFFGALVWVGFDSIFGWAPQALRTNFLISPIAHAFPGMGKEFMPPLDEGSFLYMPTTMPHASMGEALDALHKQDMLLESIHEVSGVVGKLGRVESALDPAPLSMFETIVHYYGQYAIDEHGNLGVFRYVEDSLDYFRDFSGEPALAPDGKPYLVRGAFVRDDTGALVPDSDGEPFRRWRRALDPELNPDRGPWEGVNNADDIWTRIVAVTKIPGLTSAPKLQPIATRLVMLQSGMRAPMGIKVKGPTLEIIEQFSIILERKLKQVPAIEPASVFADRSVAKPYLEISIDREIAARYGISIGQALGAIEIAVGGKTITMTVEGRERYPVRVRYQRELRDDIEALGRILVTGFDGAQIPLEQISTIEFVRGPQVIKSEDTFLIGYITFDKKAGFAEVDVVEQAAEFLSSQIRAGEIEVPNGVSYTFAGSYENQVRAEKTLALVVPLALLIIMLILYLQFRSLATTGLIFAGVFVAWSGGFLMLWLYGQDWFFNFSIFGTGMRELFQMHEIHLSVAVWVGFLALFGIATDNGVVISTILQQKFNKLRPKTIAEIRDAVISGSTLRIRPALMTTATTMLALIPVLTSSGRGSDIMVPMAIPTFGGMALAILTVFTVPVLYCAIEEMKLNASAYLRLDDGDSTAEAGERSIS